MQKSGWTTKVLVAVSFALAGAQAAAAVPAELRARFETAARQADPRFEGFSPQRGRQLFTTRGEGGWSCASCHTDDPSASGKHVKTGKEISPLAPGADPRRFTDAAKVDKWFKRNCNDVLNRACTAREKGDVLAYLMSLGR